MQSLKFEVLAAVLMVVTLIGYDIAWTGVTKEPTALIIRVVQEEAFTSHLPVKDIH